MLYHELGLLFGALDFQPRQPLDLLQGGGTWGSSNQTQLLQSGNETVQRSYDNLVLSGCTHRDFVRHAHSYAPKRANATRSHSQLGVHSRNAKEKGGRALPRNERAHTRHANFAQLPRYD